MNANELSELQRLVSLYCDEALDQAGLDELSALLAAHPEAAEVYLDLTTVHSNLMVIGTTPPEVERGSSLGIVPDSAESNLGGLVEQPPESSQFGPTNWLAFGFAGLAAMLLTLLVVQRGFIPNDTSDSEVVSVAPHDNSIAQIIRKVDCDWEDDRWAIVSSSGIESGQTLSLNRGLMELKFNSGAMITLEAPVTFTAESEMRGVLSHGKLTAAIPESAHGFTVSTPGGEAIDLGTNFGLFVGKNGVTETHVFKGEVVVRPSGVQDQKLHLTDDMALRTGGKQAQLDSLVAVPARFTRFDFEQEKSKAPVPAVDRKLSLWLSADQRLQKDENNRVSSWGDLCTNSNKSAQNAWQVNAEKRPMWVEKAIGERPAVRFGFSLSTKRC